MMLKPTRTAAPAAEPITLDEAKAALRVDFPDDDDVIASYITAATEHLDGWAGVLGRCLVTQTWRFDYDGFDDLALGLAPVQSVTVSYIDNDGATQTLSTSVYRLIVDDYSPRLELVDGQSWPEVAARSDAVRVTAVCGYGAAEDVPVAIKISMKKMVREWYDNEVQLGVPDLLTRLVRHV